MAAAQGELFSESELDSLLGIQESALDTTLDAASRTDPDQYAEDRRLASETGVPLSVVSDNRDEVKRRHQLNQVNPAQLQTDSPRTAAWLNNPDNARVSYDDIDALISIEREVSRPWWSLDSRVMKGWGDSYMIGLGKMWDQQAIHVLEEQKERDFRIRDLANPLGFVADRITDYARDLALDEEEQRQRIEKLDRKIEARKQNLAFADELVGSLTPQDLTVMEEGVRGGATMMADMATWMGATFATRGRVNLTLPYLTGKTYLDSYGSARVEGMSHDSATVYAGIDASIEMITEKIPTKTLEKIFGELSDGGVKTSIKSWLVQEAGTEQIATATQSLNAYAHGLDEELANATGLMEVLEIQGRRQAVTALSTLFGGGAMSASVKGIDYLASRERRAMSKAIEQSVKRAGSEQEQLRIDSLVSLAQSSKTNQRAKDVFDDFMEKAAPDQKVYMDASIVEDLDSPPQYLVAQLDGSTGTVEMTMAQFLSDFANDEAALALVRPHIKTREDLQTNAELSEAPDSAHIARLVKQASTEAEAYSEAKEIYDEVLTQLVATGRQGEATARQSAAIIPALVATKYQELKRNGVTNKDGSEVTVKQLYESIGMRIAGPQAAAAATGFLPQQQGQHVYHVTFTESVAGIQAEGLAPMRTSNWRRADQAEGERYNEEGGVFSFTDPRDAIRWAQKMEFDFKQPVSITKIRRDDSWEADPADDMHNFIAMGQAEGDRGQSLRSMRATRPEDFVGFINKADYGYPGPRGLSQEEWIEEMAVALEGMEISEPPRVLSQQDISDITLEESVVDEAGNAYTVRRNAQVAWDEQVARMNMVEQLRECAGV